MVRVRTVADPGRSASCGAPSQRRGPWSRICGALTAVGLGLAGLGVTVPAAAAQSETVRPVGGAFSLVGNGFGHGIGLSQWGAYGAAVTGLSGSRILDFYYPGTALGSTSDRDLRIRLHNGDNSALEVLSQGTMRLTWPGGGHLLPSVNDSTGQAIAGWRVVADSAGAGVAVQIRDVGSASFDPYLIIPSTSVGFTTDQPTLRLVRNGTRTQTDYYGRLTAVRGILSSGLLTVNTVRMESYLRGVVPQEMPASWPSAALYAQAVAARTYASYERLHPRSTAYDICDTTACQVYSGVREYSASGVLTSVVEDGRANAAISASAETVVLSAGSVAFTQFSAANGGYTVAGAAPYLIAQPDPYDGAVPNSANSWAASPTVAKVSAAWPAVGTATALVVTTRDGRGPHGGRVLAMQVVGTTGSVSLTGDAFRSAMGLRSNLFSGAASASIDHDVTHDSYPDMIALQKGTGRALLFAGLSSGAFAEPSTIATGWGSVDALVAPGDTNGDTIPDVLSRTSDGLLWLRTLNATGVPAPPRQIGYGWQGMVTIRGAGDLSGDGLPDVLGQTTAGDLYLYPMDASGSIVGKYQIGNGWNGLDHLVAGVDVTGDGIPDVIARRTSTGQLLLYAGSSTGRLVNAIVIGTGWQPFDLLTISTASNGSASIIGRLPATASGELRRYPVKVASVPLFGTATTAGTGWNSLLALW